MTYHMNPDFSYAVDIQDAKLIDNTNGKLITLRYPEAAIFDLLIKQYSHKTMVRMLSKIGLMTDSHAENLIGDTIDFLVQNNVIMPEQSRG
ncbi:hypothetical protein L0Z72_00850 [candidate division KSB1 bacterium]|nr:hypothetical protein [candidate division KSB1 bacterium]